MKCSSLEMFNSATGDKLKSAVATGRFTSSLTGSVKENTKSLSKQKKFEVSEF